MHADIKLDIFQTAAIPLRKRALESLTFKSSRIPVHIEQPLLAPRLAENSDHVIVPPA